MKRTLLLIGFLTICSICFIPIGYSQTEISFPSEESTVINPPVEIAIPDDTYFYLQWSHMNTGNVPVFQGLNTGAYCGLSGFDMNIPEAWEYMNNQTLSQVKVGILDSGLDPNIDPATSDLDTDRLLDGMNFSDSSPDFNTTDILGHGTHVLGAIAATVNNGRGIAGVDRNCLVMPIKIDPTGTREQRANIAAAIYHGIQNDIKVFNMSWGWNEITIDNDIREAISYGIANGCTFVGAAGNDNNDTIDFPAKVAIAVGAANPCGSIKSPATSPGCEQDSRSETLNGPEWGSNYGAGLDLMGPGTMLPAVDIIGPSGLSAYTNCNEGTCYLPAENGNYVRDAFGTSIAAPYVTGIVSQMLAINNQLSMHEIEYLLLKASVSPMIGGYKFPDAFEAVVLASDHTPGSHPVADLTVDQVVYERINTTSVRATVTISNRSTSVASASTQLSVYTSFTEPNSYRDALGPNGNSIIPIAAIPANTTQTYQVIIPYDEHPGPPTLQNKRLWLNAVIDPDMLLEESDKANNAMGIMVTHDQAFLPDLRPYEVSYTTSSGNIVQLNYKIKNENEKTAVFPSGSVVTKFWASTDGILDTLTDLPIGSQTIQSPLTIAYLEAPQFSKSLTLSHNYLIIQVDPNKIVAEGNEINNKMAIQITTTPTGFPDLHPSNVSYSVNVTSLGKAVNMSYGIKNSGTANGTLYYLQDAVRYWDSYDDVFSSDDQQLGSENMNGVFTIQPQQSMLFPNKNKLATRSFLLIQVIPDTQHGETNTANNFYAIPLIQTTGSDEEQTDPSGDQQQIVAPKQLKEEVHNTDSLVKTDSDKLSVKPLPISVGRFEADVLLSDGPQLEIFPNPAREQVTLAIEMNGTGQITLMDLMGNRLYEQLLTENYKHKLVMDTGYLSAGAYFVELKEVSGKSTLKKLIIH